MDGYADSLAAIIEALDLGDATLVGKSTGSGEVARYIGIFTDYDSALVDVMITVAEADARANWVALHKLNLDKQIQSQRRTKWQQKEKSWC